jgi:hypothetical protein
MNEQAETLRETAEADYARVRNQTELTPAARLKAIAQIYVALDAAIDALASTLWTTKNARRDTLSRQLFGIPAGADGAAVSSYRDAQDRARKLDYESDAIAAYNQAAQIGDDTMTRAILAEAYGQRWSNLINTYTANNPTKEANADELWDLTMSIDSPVSLLNSADFFVPKPPELSGARSDYQIRELATSTAA